MTDKWNYYPSSSTAAVVADTLLGRIDAFLLVFGSWCFLILPAVTN